MAATFFRKVIKISALDSPNVQLALAEKAAGREPSNREVIPGVLTWQEYCHRLATWDPVRKVIGLDGEFYMGAQLLLFPPEWLDAAEKNFALIASSNRKAKSIGIDPGEGGANSSWCVIDELGVIELASWKTPDTTEITRITIDMMEKHNVPANRVAFDTGGGGKQHVDRLRAGINGKRWNVRAIGFGKVPQLDPIRRMRMIEEKVDSKEDAYAYVNMRAQMYHEVSQLLDPALNLVRGLPGFAIPAGITTGERCHVHGAHCLRAQLSVMPKMTDQEGRYKLPPKSRRDPEEGDDCLTDRIGHSPDEADALALSVHALLHEARRAKVSVGV